MELTGTPDGYEDVTVRFSTHPDEGQTSGGVVSMYNVDSPGGIFFTLEEVKAIQAFLSEIIYEASRSEDEARVAW